MNYKAFVSSTFIDLKSHRTRVITGLRRAGLHVDPMEDWPADSEEPKAFSRQRLADCNLCILLVGLRRGFVPEAESRSITQLEYEEALARHIDVIPFLVRADGTWNTEFDERTADPGVDQWRSDLQRRYGVEWFEANPDSLDVVPAVTRWIMKRSEEDVSALLGGLGQLESLIRSHTDVARAVGQSRVILENFYRHLGRLDLYKLVHDCLHTIEFQVLWPLQTGAAASGSIRPFKIAFASEAKKITDAARDPAFEGNLREDIRLGLEPCDLAFAAAVKEPSNASVAGVIAELNTLLSHLPSSLDTSICNVAGELDIAGLVTLMETVRVMPGGQRAGPGLDLLKASSGALGHLRDQLAQLVTDHGRLQRLDLKLRSVCVGGTPPDAVAKEWKRISTVRAALDASSSVEFAIAREDLAAQESEVASAIDDGKYPAALELIRGYFLSVGTVFRGVDQHLRTLCMQLTRVGQPVKTILDLV